MHCDGASVLMVDVLDGASPDELDAHLRVCPRCAAEWAALQLVDGVLRAQVPVHPPPNLSSRIMCRIDREARQLLDWRDNLMQIAVIVAGTAWVLTSVVLFVRGWRLTLGGADLAASGQSVLEVASVFGTALWGTVARDAVTRALYAATAVIIAAIWFGVLVVPRLGRVLVVRRP